MSFRYPAGLITASSPINANYPSGVWTPRQALPYLQNGVWGQDPFFDQTVLLLHGDGTNGAQNNTFLDSSSNNFTITRNGNTTQGTFTPFSLAAGEWSNYFPAQGYVTYSSNPISFGTGATFTVEGWINLQSAPATNYYFAFLASADASTLNYWTVGINSLSQPSFYWFDGSLRLTTAPAISLNTWVHIAFVSNAGSIKIFVNGVDQTLTGGPTTLTNPTGNASFVSGAERNSSGVGYLSNIRTTTTALYTNNFTVPTVPLSVAPSNTTLLSLQSNRFVDNNTQTAAKTVTPFNSVRVTPFSPFQPLLAYSPGVTGGSGYFDGSGDFLAFSNNTVFDFGTGDFTIECWIYRLGTGSGSTIYDSIIGGNEPTPSYWNLYVNNSNNTIMWFGNDGVTRSSSNTITNNSWNHIVVTRSSSTLKIFINGVEGYSATVTTSYSLGTGGGRVALDGPTTSTGNRYFFGYISNIRVLKGTGYSSISVPTAPLTAITNTSLLLNFTNASIIDNTAKNVLETVGNAQIDTAVVKYGTGSMEFDGSGDYLAIRATTNDFFAFGTGNFTIEFWLYLNSTAQQIIYDGRPGSATPTIYYYNNAIRYYANAADRITGSALNTGQWYYIVVTRSGTETKMFIDGTQSGSTYVDSTNYTTSTPIIGADANSGTFNNNLNGYIDDLRVTKGIARYTANFVPPVARFPNQ